MARSLKSVRHLLKDKPTLKRLQLEISAQKALLTRIRQYLPADLAEHCLAAQRHDDLLVVHTDSAAWATRLRYFAPRLASLLRPEIPTLREIKVRLLLDESRRPSRSRPAHRSDTAAAIIHDSALDTKHPQLRAALLRLSETLKTQKTQ